MVWLLIAPVRAFVAKRIDGDVRSRVRGLAAAVSGLDVLKSAEFQDRAARAVDAGLAGWNRERSAGNAAVGQLELVLRVVSAVIAAALLATFSVPLALGVLALALTMRAIARRQWMATIDKVLAIDELEAAHGRAVPAVPAAAAPTPPTVWFENLVFDGLALPPWGKTGWANDPGEAARRPLSPDQRAHHCGRCAAAPAAAGDGRALPGLHALPGEPARQRDLVGAGRDRSDDEVPEALRSGGAPPTSLRSGIALEGVCFRYPAAERDALSEVDLCLPAGSTVAAVGANAAGKSTLIKLLTGLHQPTSGRITVDGVPLSTLDTEQ